MTGACLGSAGVSPRAANPQLDDRHTDTGSGGRLVTVREFPMRPLRSRMLGALGGSTLLGSSAREISVVGFSHDPPCRITHLYENPSLFSDLD